MPRGSSESLCSGLQKVSLGCMTIFFILITRVVDIFQPGARAISSAGDKNLKTGWRIIPIFSKMQTMTKSHYDLLLTSPSGSSSQSLGSNEEKPDFIKPLFDDAKMTTCLSLGIYTRSDMLKFFDHLCSQLCYTDSKGDVW